MTTARIKMNAFAQACLIRTLFDRPANCQELAEETGLHYVTVQQYMRELRRAGAAHIHAWEKDARGRDIIKVYAIGPGKDAKREKLTAVQRQHRLREKRKQAQLAQVMAGAARYVQAANGRLRFEVIT